MMTKAPMGSLGYIAPESIENYTYSEKSDVFSLGMVFYAIITGIFPTTLMILNPNISRIEDQLKESYKIIQKGLRLDFEGIGIENEYMKVIQSMVSFNPEDRPSLEQIEKSLIYKPPNNLK